MKYRYKNTCKLQALLLLIFMVFAVFLGSQEAASSEDTHEWTVNTIGWNPNDNYGLIGGTNGLIARYDGESVELVSIVPVKAKQISWNRNGSSAIIAGYGGVYLYEDSLFPLKLGSNFNFRCVDWDPTGRYALIGGHTGSLPKGFTALLLFYDGTELVDITHLIGDTSNISIAHIAWNPREEFALIYTDCGKLYEFRDSEIIFTKKIEDIFDMAWKPDGSELLFLFDDLSLASWDRCRPFALDVLTKGQGRLSWRSGILSWKPDSSLVLVAGCDTADNQWKVYKYDGGLEFIEKLAERQINDIAWHPSGKYAFAVGSYSGSGGMLQKIIVPDENSHSDLTPSLLAVSIIAVTMIVYFGLTETGRYICMEFIFLPLFTKIKKKHPLENKMRELIYEYIKLYPGQNYTTIKKTLGLANGTLVYHLKILKKEDPIKAVSEGRHKRFYPLEPDELDKSKLYEYEGEPQMLTELQIKIINKIEEKPDISQVEVARSLGVSRQLVNYHITKLVKVGVLKLKGKTKSKSCTG
ncbi:MAG: winged helix-turn-helix transcriptional regulator [Methanomassiliicoccales archaeon]|nr:MAG: winged helix-turn-helix transcriptional regulator [Methanomassiliicoccales archaeon]